MKAPTKRISSWLLATALALFPVAHSLGAEPTESAEPEAKQRLFETPDAAGKALLEAAKAKELAGLVAIFGPGSEDILASGDPVGEETTRQRFITAYETKHAWTEAPGDARILTVGELDWPLPIPLVHTAEGWRFDTARGREEILDRRVGRNELSAIQSCLALVDAEREYYAENPTGGPPQYAQRIASSEGKKDGLYWPVEEGQKESPLGPIFARARAEGYTPGEGKRAPYHGYLYKILTAQGEAASGGAKSYIQDGAMTEGFALIAWPAKYGSSGVMTFLVNETGVVYEKNLGPETATKAGEIKEFDPDVSWDVVSGAALVPEDEGDSDEG